MNGCWLIIKLKNIYSFHHWDFSKLNQFTNNRIMEPERLNIIGWAIPTILNIEKYWRWLLIAISNLKIFLLMSMSVIWNLEVMLYLDFLVLNWRNLTSPIGIRHAVPNWESPFLLYYFALILIGILQPKMILYKYILRVCHLTFMCKVFQRMIHLNMVLIILQLVSKYIWKETVQVWFTF